MSSIKSLLCSTVPSPEQQEPAVAFPSVLPKDRAATALRQLQSPALGDTRPAPRGTVHSQHSSCASSQGKQHSGNAPRRALKEI